LKAAAATAATSIMSVIFSDVPAVARDDTVVFIKVTSADGRLLRAQGSGTLLNSGGFILTVRHLLDSRAEFDRVTVSLKSGNRAGIPISGDPICADKPVDLCLLKIGDNDVRAESLSQFYQLGCRPLRTMENVVAVGYALGESQTSQVPGTISSGIGSNSTHPTTIPLLPGMSGGPVVDASGTVVAVVASGATLPTTDDRRSLATVRTFVMPLSYASNLLSIATAPCSMGSTPSALVRNSSVFVDGFIDYDRSAFSFVSNRVVAWNSPEADIGVSSPNREQSARAEFFLFHDAPPYHGAQDANARGGIRDMNTTSLSEVVNCPTSGYKIHFQSAELGRVYCVRLRSGGQYVKLKVQSTDADRISFEWESAH
jgi:Trypsin-like peptidase domain